MDEHVVEALLDLVRVDALAHRQVPLRVEVNAEHPVAGLGEGHRQVQGRRRLRDAALLVGEGDYLGVLDRHLGLRLLHNQVMPRGDEKIGSLHPAVILVIFLRSLGLDHGGRRRGYRSGLGFGLGFGRESGSGRGLLGHRCRRLGRFRVLFLGYGLSLGNGFLHTAKLLDDRVLLLDGDGCGLWLAA